MPEFGTSDMSYASDDAVLVLLQKGLSQDWRVVRWPMRVRISVYVLKREKKTSRVGLKQRRHRRADMTRSWRSGPKADRDAGGEHATCRVLE